MTAQTATDGMHATSLIARLQGDLVHVQDHRYTAFLPQSRPGRGVIESFSRESAARLRDYLLACDARYSVFGTLTYPFGNVCGTTPALAKSHLRALFERLRRLWGGCASIESICWWMEFTQAGMVHFHFLSTRFVCKKWLARSWYEVVGSEDIRHWQAGTQVDTLRSRGDSIRYAAKYATKQVTSHIGKGNPVGRWWGVFGKRSVVEADLYAKGGPDGLESDRIAAMTDEFQTKLCDFVRAGRGKVLPNYWGGGGVFTVRIPDINDRRLIRGFMMDLCYSARAAYVSEDDPLPWNASAAVFD